MKKYFIMAVAVLASLTACQKDPEQIIVNDGTIKFMSLQTRATVTDTTGISDLQKDDAFQLYGYIKGEPNALFADERPDYEAPNWETTGNVKYWADAKYYNFYAFYPAQTVSAEYDKASFTFDGSAGNIDLVAASRCEILGKVTNAPVQLTFEHQLARIAFNFVNKFNDPNISIKVTEIKLLQVPTTAKFTYKAGTTANSIASVEVSETNLSDINYTFPADDIVISGSALDAQTYDSLKTNYMYVVPSTGKYQMTCKVEYSNMVDEETEVIKTETYTVDVTNANYSYAAGQSYVFTANVYDVVSPITFSVSVTPWGVDISAGDINIGPGNNK